MVFVVFCHLAADGDDGLGGRDLLLREGRRLCDVV